MFPRFGFVAAFILAGLTTFEAFAVERRVAFVIGNSNYQEISALKNPAKDVADVSETFRAAGFEVFLVGAGVIIGDAQTNERPGDSAGDSPTRRTRQNGGDVREPWPAAVYREGIEGP